MSTRPRWSLSDPGALPWSGGAVGSVATCVLAPNPGPMTLDGTNTWIIGAPGAAEVVVIDPGPQDQAHQQAILRAADRASARICAVLLTHGHLDHSQGAQELARICGVGVRALDPRHTLGAQGLVHGQELDVAGVRLSVHATPGHTADSLCFVLDHEGAGSVLLTGDTVLGRGTAVIAHPDGVLGAYLASLDRLDRLIAELGVSALLPGHGPALEEPARVIEAYRRHRQQRLDAVRAAVQRGSRGVREVTDAVYGEIDPRLRAAAELSVAAQLAYLAQPNR